MALYAFDGTWNSEKDAGEYDRNTNVVRFKDLYAGPKFFYKGVGTKHGFVGKVAGGAFGVGGHDRIEDAKRDMAKLSPPAIATSTSWVSAAAQHWQCTLPMWSAMTA